MHPYEIMSEPIRRRIVEILSSGEHTAGNLQEVVMHEFGVGRSAVDYHLAYLRARNWVFVREEWPNRNYQLDEEVVPALENEARTLRRRWDRRVYTSTRIGDRTPQLIGRKGRRGRGKDPDDLWWATD